MGAACGGGANAGLISVMLPSLVACCDDSDSIVTEREGARPVALLFVTCGCPFFLSLPLSEVRFDTSYYRIDGMRKLTWRAKY